MKTATRTRPLHLLASLLLALATSRVLRADGAGSPGSAQLGSSMVQSIPLNASRPLFLPTHPRVATTLRFPGPIGAPEGRGFTEDESKHPGEYPVSWTPGESHLTVTPLPGAGPLNLNIPYEGDIYVAYFYPVERQLAAVTCVKLMPPDTRTGTAYSPNPAAPTSGLPASLEQANSRRDKTQEVAPGAASPSQLEGFLDKLRLLCTCADAGSLVELSHRLGLQVAVTPSSSRIAPRGTFQAEDKPEEPCRHFGGMELRIRLVARNEALNTLGFVFLLRNPGSRPKALDVSSFSIRAGDLLLGQALGDAPAILMPGEERPAFILFQCPNHSPLRLDNDWKPSFDLLPDEEQAEPLAANDKPNGP